MGLNNFTGFKANGTIAPNRFVIQDASGDNLVIEGGVAQTYSSGSYGAAQVPTLGISQVGQKRTPGLAGSDVTVAAAQGDVIQLFGLGDICPLQLAGTVIRGDPIVVNGSTDGRGIALATTPNATFQAKYVGARALQSGTTGQLVLVQIQGYYV